MQALTARLLAVLICAAHAIIWILVAHWERAGRAARLRASLPLPPVAVRGGYVALVVPLLYPAVVAIVRQWGYEGWLNWSSRIDVALQAVGLALWATGMIVLVWAARVLVRYLDVDGVTSDHELVVSGPYRHVRHPVYASFTAMAVGLGLAFRSYLLAAVAAVWLAASIWWAAAEEALLGSPEGLGDTYRAYRERTGRFLPRPRHVRR